MAEEATTQVYYVNDVGWVMSYPSTSAGQSANAVALPELGVVRLVDASGHQTQLQVVPADADVTGLAQEPGGVHPLTHPVSITAEGLYVEVEESPPMSERLSFLAQWRPGQNDAEEPRHDCAPITLLDSVSFGIGAGELVGVVGPSGAGKSTLIRALLGETDFSGILRYNAELVDPEDPQSVARLRTLFGYVPQQDVLHGDLPVKEALLYSARLRLPGLSRNEQRVAVMDVLKALGLVELANKNKPLRVASGGQRKRASAATELLTRPPVLFLDEPTTGLDPDTEENLMRLLGDLAHRGNHTVVFVTHSISALEMADKILVIAGGRLAYAGPPELAQTFFAPARFAAHERAFDGRGAPAAANPYLMMYQRLREDAEGWASRFEQSNYYQQFVEMAIERNRSAVPDETPSTHRWASPRSQFLTLAHRNASVILGAGGYARLLAAQTPVLVAALLLFVGLDNLSGGADRAPRALLTFLVFSAVAVGLIDSCREIVKELAIYNRERTVGLSVGAYLAAKFAVLAGLAFGQAVILSSVLLVQGGAATGLLIPWRFAENAFLLWIGILATVSLGLLISSIAGSDSRAQVMIPIILVVQLLFTGALIDTQKPVIQELSWASGSYWLFAGVASSNGLADLDPACTSPAAGSTRGAVDGAGRSVPAAADCPEMWRHDKSVVAVSLCALIALTVGQLAIAWLALTKRRSGVAA